MKQALIVDPHRQAEDFASSALRLYEKTTVRSMQDAMALASGADYDLVLIAPNDALCEGSPWTMLERLARLVSVASLVMVLTREPDAAFQTRAAGIGVAVLTVPLGITAWSLIDEVAAS